uniref:Capsid protein n=1 Tax=unidentified TaxID=32644 RepID=A0A6G9W332_9ZZZZ|nr:capsid protein [unidentified]
MLRRRSYRPYRRGPKKNYQIMRPWFYVQSQTAQGAVTVIDPAQVTGIRKVKNFSIEFQQVDTQPQQVVAWALVYVPAGYQPNRIADPPADTMYSPTNNVIMAGIFDTSDPVTTGKRFSRLSRLLREGDGIALVFGSQKETQVHIRVQMTFAITI